MSDGQGADEARGTPQPQPRPCPICRKPSMADFAPFCSARCRDVDLGRWLTGTYAVPTDEPPDEEK